MHLGKILSVAGFEFRRSLSLGRLSAFAILSLFPPAMLLLISRVASLDYFELQVFFLTYVVCLLALLLWATPNIYAELENRNWIFVSTRPQGRISLLLGKWLAAVGSGFLVTFTATTLSLAIVLIRLPPGSGEAARMVFHVWLKMCVVWLIACIEYATLYSLIGTLFQRRAMVIAAVYTVVIEGVLAFVPALVSKFAVRYHLTGVVLAWFGWILPGPKPDPATYQDFFAGLPLWMNIAVLAAIPPLVLGVAAYVIRTREFPTSDEL